jgi:hypothetical protein
MHMYNKCNLGSLHIGHEYLDTLICCVLQARGDAKARFMYNLCCKEQTIVSDQL